MISIHNKRGEKLSTLKLTVVQYCILFMMLALMAQLWRLQVLGAQNFRMLAEQNRIRKVPILAPRGKLFDRENRLVVDNYPSVSCFLVREQNRNVDADLPLIARGLNLDLDQLRATLLHYRAAPGYQPIPIKQDITADEQAFIEAHRNELPELETIHEERRLYPRDGFASHLIGYVGEVSEEDLNNPRFAYYEPGDVVGKAGVEETYDQLLRGQDGSREVIVDSHGREVGYLGIQHAIPGQDLKLTIDNDLQRAAELALGNRNGAIVAMDPRNGEILAMVSRPSFDPNAFAVRINKTDWNKLITDPDHPLMNKSYPGATGSGVDVQGSHVGGRSRGRDRAGHEDQLSWGVGAVWVLPPLRRAPWRGGYPHCNSLLLRHVLLHAGRQAGDRQDRKVRDGIRLSGRRPGSICPANKRG